MTKEIDLFANNINRKRRSFIPERRVSKMPLDLDETLTETNKTGN